MRINLPNKPSNPNCNADSKTLPRKLHTTRSLLQDKMLNKSTTTRTTQFMVRAEEGSVLYLYTKFEADCSIRSKVIKGFQNLEIRSRDPGHAQLGSFMVLTQRGSVVYVTELQI